MILKVSVGSYYKTYSDHVPLYEAYRVITTVVPEISY